MGPTCCGIGNCCGGAGGHSTIKQSRVWPDWKRDSFVRMPGCSTCAETEAKRKHAGLLGACIEATLKSGRGTVCRVEAGLALTKSPQGISEEAESRRRPRAEMGETSFYFWSKPEGVPVLKCPGLVDRRRGVGIPSSRSCTGQKAWSRRCTPTF